MSWFLIAAGKGFDILDKGKKQNKTASYLFKTLLIVGLAIITSLALGEAGIMESNILMVYLIGVLIVIIETGGYFWGILASVICVFSFNYYFTQPLYSFEVSDPNYILTFFIFFIVAVIASTISSRLKKQVRISRQKEAQTSHLYEISSGYLNISGVDNIVDYGIQSLALVQDRKCLIYIARNFAQLEDAYYRQEDFPDPTVIENKVPAEWCYANMMVCGYGTSYYPSSPWKYFPIISNGRALGVLAVYCQNEDIESEEMIFVHTVISQMALALERESLYSQQEEGKIEIEKEKLRNNLLRAISHDLRTPLTAIAGSAGFIIDSYDSLDKETVIGLLTDIGKDVTWLNNLVENLLHMTRIQDGRLIIEKRNEVVDDVVSAAVSRIKHLSKPDKLTIKIPDEVLLVPMDSDLIVQVLVNLLDNAIKHTREGTSIALNAYRQESHIVFEVSDDGGGIREDILDKVFESFVAAQREKTDAHRGIGLGLSICKAIVEAHGGTIEAFNNEKGGATFRFTLPLAKEEIEDESAIQDFDH